MNAITFSSILDNVNLYAAFFFQRLIMHWLSHVFKNNYTSNLLIFCEIDFKYHEVIDAFFLSN